jgi:hypothetical protein
MTWRLGPLLDRFRPVKADQESRERIKAWVRDALALAPDDGVTVNEIACNDPACPGLETVILVMRRSERTKAYKCRGSAIVQTRRDIVAALCKEA